MDDLVAAEGPEVMWAFGEDAGDVAGTHPGDVDELVVSYAEQDDIPAVMAVEEASWPETDDGMQADPVKFEQRQETGNLLTATYHGDEYPAHDGEIVGSISVQQPAWTDADTVTALLDEHAGTGLNWESVVADYGFPADWYAATDDGYIAETHDPDGDTGFLIGVGVHPDVQGNGFAGHLLNAALAEFDAGGQDLIVGYARAPGYHEHDVPIDDYVDTDQAPIDPVIGFHEDNGATVVCPIPGAMPDDAESEGYGALVVYDPAALDLPDKQGEAYRFPL